MCVLLRPKGYISWSHNWISVLVSYLHIPVQHLVYLVTVSIQKVIVQVLIQKKRSYIHINLLYYWCTEYITVQHVPLIAGAPTMYVGIQEWLRDILKNTPIYKRVQQIKQTYDKKKKANAKNKK